MKKILVISLILSAVLTITVSAFYNHHNSENDLLNLEQYSDTISIPPVLGLEDAKIKFNYLMANYTVFCWVSNGLPLEYANEIEQAWKESLENNIDYIPEVVFTTQIFTYYEFYQKMLVEYLSGASYALQSAELDYIAKLAELSPDSMITMNSTYIDSYRASFNTGRVFTYYEFYKKMLDEYLIGAPHANSWEYIEHLAELAAITPDKTRIVTMLYFSNN